MNTCAEKKQTTLTKTFTFPKFTLEFTLRGLNYGEFKAYKEKINNNANNSDYLRIKAKSEVAKVDKEAESITVEEVERFAELTDQINTRADLLDFELLVNCLTSNIAYDAGFKVKKATDAIKKKIKKLDDALSLLEPSDIQSLAEIAYNLTTLSKSGIEAKEVAEDEVK